MNLDQYVSDLQNRLGSAAAAGGEDTRAVAERLVDALDASVRLVLLRALSDAAAEISSELAPGSVDVRLRSGEPELVVTPAGDGPSVLLPPAVDTRPGAGSPEAPAGTAASSGVEGGPATRTTLRLPDHLKTRVEAAAARDGISVNSWFVRAIAAALDQTTAPAPRTAASGQRITGWVR